MGRLYGQREGYGTGMPEAPAGDLMALIKEHHQGITLDFNAVEESASESRTDAFVRLVEDLVGHEVAEELVIYPPFRRLGAGEIADACLAEQNEAEQILTELEKFVPDSTEFLTTMERLKRLVLDHAAREEAEVLPRLQASCSPAELSELARRYSSARSSAPTHPHPNAPDQPPVNRVLVPVAALIDRIRDTVKGRNPSRPGS